MLKNLCVGVFLVGITLFLVNLVFGNTVLKSNTSSFILSPTADDYESNSAPLTPEELRKQNSVFKDSKILNVLLVGTDTSFGRRQRGQLGFNTDVMILLSVNPEKNIVLMTSVPRDLWINGNKINSLYVLGGWENLKNAYENITGQKIDGYITIDFDGFRWLVDSFGGVPVEVKNSFTDLEFPNIQDSGAEPVTFTAGVEQMSSERALSYARSRKGNNGEGSDLMRAKRQHLILEGMVKAISQPESIFWPMDIPNFFNLITQHMETSLTLDDVYYLWDFYKDRSKYTFESFIVGSDYIYHPGMYPDSPYHAWVFVPINGSFEKLHEDIVAKLEGTFVSENMPEETSTEKPVINNPSAPAGPVVIPDSVPQTQL